MIRVRVSVMFRSGLGLQLVLQLVLWLELDTSNKSIVVKMILRIRIMRPGATEHLPNGSQRTSPSRSRSEVMASNFN